MDSREALLGALATGLDGVELDVQFTADSVLVAFHDLELDERTACTGPVHSRSWVQLKNCPNEERADHPYPIVRVDSLLLDAAQRFPNAEFTLDVKLNTQGEWWPYLNAFSDAIRALAMRPELVGRVIMECQTEDLLGLMHDKTAEVPLHLYGTGPGAAIERASALGCAGITINNDLVSQADVARAKEQGLQVTLFGISGQWELREALDKEPDRIQLDHDR